MLSLLRPAHIAPPLAILGLDGYLTCEFRTGVLHISTFFTFEDTTFGIWSGPEMVAGFQCPGVNYLITVADGAEMKLGTGKCRLVAEAV